MIVSWVLIAMGFIFGGVSTGVTICILNNLENQKLEVNWLNVRWNLFKYLKSYKELTKRDSGKVGTLYYLFWIFTVLGLLCLGGGVITLVQFEV